MERKSFIFNRNLRNGVLMVQTKKEKDPQGKETYVTRYSGFDVRTMRQDNQLEAVATGKNQKEAAKNQREATENIAKRFRGENDGTS